MRQAVVEALGAIGEASKEVVEALSKRLREDDDAVIRSTSVAALAAMQARSAVPALKVAFRDPSQLVREQVLRALQQLDPGSLRDLVKP
jgi:HEAT repeat protein